MFYGIHTNFSSAWIFKYFKTQVPRWVLKWVRGYRPSTKF